MKNKKLILKILCFLIILIINLKISKEKNIFADILENKTSTVQYIYNQNEFTTNEEVILIINLTNTIKVSEIDLRIKIDHNILQPIMENNRYFTFTALSIFENEDIINSYTDDILWLKLIKTHDIKNDYVITTKNNVGIIKFTTLSKIKNIEDYLNDETIKIDIFDSLRNKISITSNYSEKITYNWTLNSNSIMVNSKNLNLNDYLTITNRLPTEYKLTINDNINYQKIGLYEIKISIYDLINQDIINEIIRINIVDTLPPEITSKPVQEIIEIKDTNLKDLKLNSLFNYIDNYDQYVNILYEYYTIENEQLLSYEQFINYLTTNQMTKFKVYAADSSGNTSEKLEYIIKIKDTTPPIITTDEKIEIMVGTKFNLNDYITITDNYDPNPSFTTTYYYEDQTECFDIENAIKTGKNLIIKIIGFDKENNFSKEKIVKLNVIDNVSPEIIITSNELEDKFIKNFDYLNHFEFNDNVSQNLKITFIFGTDQVDNIKNNNEINKKFQELLSKNLQINFAIQVKDETGNATLIENATFTIIDTTAPDIIIKNIENKKTYNDISQIDYEIIDQYSKEIKVDVTINNEPYNGYLSLNDGLNYLSITATDEFNNSKTINLEFSIEPKMEEQNTKMPNILKNDFTSETIFLLAVLVLSLIIVIYRIFLINYKTKHKIHK